VAVRAGVASEDGLPSRAPGAVAPAAAQAQGARMLVVGVVPAQPAVVEPEAAAARARAAVVRPAVAGPGRVVV